MTYLIYQYHSFYRVCKKQRPKTQDLKNKDLRPKNIHIWGMEVYDWNKNTVNPKIVAAMFISYTVLKIVSHNVNCIPQCYSNFN
jgi:hypothetical protein